MHTCVAVADMLSLIVPVIDRAENLAYTITSAVNVTSILNLFSINVSTPSITSSPTAASASIIGGSFAVTRERFSSLLPQEQVEIIKVTLEVGNIITNSLKEPVSCEHSPWNYQLPDS